MERQKGFGTEDGQKGLPERVVRNDHQKDNQKGSPEREARKDIQERLTSSITRVDD